MSAEVLQPRWQPAYRPTPQRNLQSTPVKNSALPFGNAAVLPCAEKSPPTAVSATYALDAILATFDFQPLGDAEPAVAA